MTPTQCRAARALLDWSQQNLSDISGVGIVTIRQFEMGNGSPRPATCEAIAGTLERAGVEFLVGNGKGEGVRLRESNSSLTEFLAFLRLYDQKLRTKARHDQASGLPQFGYSFVSHNREGADLMYRSARLGTVRWSNGSIVFDPPLPRGEQRSLADSTFDKWLALAELRAAIGG